MSTSVPAALSGRRLVVVDVEGNGQSPPEIVEIAALPIGGSIKGPGLVDYAAVRSWLVRPQNPIAAVLTRTVHGISNPDVAGCPSWSLVADDILAILDRRVLVAHHAHVEHRILCTHLPGWRPPLVLDTLRLAKHVWPGLPSYSLAALADHAHLDLTALDHTGTTRQRHHRARYDTWCAWQLLRALLDHNSTPDTPGRDDPARDDAAQGELGWDGLVAVAALPESITPTPPEGGLW